MLVGCGADGATLLVDLRTDWAAGIEFVAVRTEVVDGGGTVTESRERAALATTDFGAGARVAEIAGLGGGAVTLRVRLLDGRGADVAEKQVRVTVRGRVAVTVVIARACPTGTCPTCSTDAECVPAASCAQGACSEGMCLHLARSGACTAPLYCDPAVGCVEPPGTDAGLPPEPDAGPGPCGVCATGETCDASTGMCVPCGGDGERCCDADLCSAGRVCSGGTCTPCGGNGEPCCAGRSCDAARICGVDGACRDCGSAGQPCCASDTCAAGLVCGVDGACRNCGGRSEPCCGGGTCDRGLMCMAGTCAP